MTFLGQIKEAICPGNSLLTLAHVEEKGIRNQGPFPQLSFRLSQLEVVSRPMDQLSMWSSVLLAQAQRKPGLYLKLQTQKQLVQSAINH